MDRIKPLADRSPPRPIADGVRIGHVHLKVADLDRALSFYCDVLGFELTQRRGREAAFLCPADIIITSRSTPGRVPAVRRRRPAAPGSTIWPFSIPRVLCWPTPCAG